MPRGSCVLLFSGGLDSLLAKKYLEKLGFRTITLYCSSPFFSKVPAEVDRVIDITEEMIEAVKNPRFGYGKNLNPCLDCKIIMYSKARELMVETEADFVATGEVVGQRPFTQTRHSLNKISKEAGLKGMVVRVLCGKLLPPTEPEKRGIIRREELLSLSGRGRKKNMELAKELGIEEFPSPAGGCKLTDPEYSKRARKFIELGLFSIATVPLLSVGRHFPTQEGVYIVSRNAKEERFLRTFNFTGKAIYHNRSKKAPVVVYVGGNQDFIPELAKELIKRYAKEELSDDFSIVEKFND